MPRKIGRNDPCFCGSGKKFKKCCLDTKDISEEISDDSVDQELDSNQIVKPIFFTGVDRNPDFFMATFVQFETSEESIEELEYLSNVVLDLVKAKKFEMGHTVCDLLTKKYPDQSDGFDRRAYIYEAQSQYYKAIEFYQKAIDLTHEIYGLEFETAVNSYKNNIERLWKKIKKPAKASKV